MLGISQTGNKQKLIDNLNSYFVSNKVIKTLKERSYEETSVKDLIYFCIKNNIKLKDYSDKQMMYSKICKYLSTQFIRAVEESNVSQIDFFLELGADIHFDNDDAVKISIDIDDLQILKILEKKGMEIKKEENLTLALIRNSRDIVTFLVNKNVKIVSKDGNFGDVDTLKLVSKKLSELDINKAFLYNAQNGNLEEVEYLLSIGADIHFDKNAAFESLWEHIREYLMNISSTKDRKDSSKEEKYYKVLEVSESATKNDIKKSYKKLALKYHPDKNRDSDKFKGITEAFQYLMK
jgi:ankyrin repeat protein